MVMSVMVKQQENTDKKFQNEQNNFLNEHK